MKLYTIFYKIIFIVAALVLVAFSLKGASDIGYFSKTYDTKVTGPFEASNSTSRYALTETIVNDRKFDFNAALAAFSSPDVVSYKGKFFTVFTPGVSLLAAPFYAIGKIANVEQFSTYLFNTLISIFNIILVFKISRKLNVSFYASMLASFIFAFATNAYVYSQSLTQHPMTTFILLAMLLNLFKKRTMVNNFIFGFLAAFSLLIDIPNAFLVFPLLIAFVIENIKVLRIKDKLRLSVNLKVAIVILGLLLPSIIFAGYNKNLTGSYTKIAQFIGRDENIQNVELGRPTEEAPSTTYTLHLPFNTRRLLSGFYILVVSDERGIFYYSPVLILGLIGMYLAYKNQLTRKYSLLFLAVTLVNLLTYAMFGDPWGGWSFGPRYLIPSAALLSILLGFTLDRYRKNLIFIVLFFALLIFSVSINTLGTLTTSSIPPKQEAINLITPIPYTYEYNWDILNKNISGSYLFNSMVANKLNLNILFYILSTISFMTIFLGYIGFYFSSKNNKKI